MNTLQWIPAIRPLHIAVHPTIQTFDKIQIISHQPNMLSHRSVTQLKTTMFNILRFCRLRKKTRTKNITLIFFLFPPPVVVQHLICVVGKKKNCVLLGQCAGLIYWANSSKTQKQNCLDNTICDNAGWHFTMGIGINRILDGSQVGHYIHWIIQRESTLFINHAHIVMSIE